MLTEETYHLAIYLYLGAAGIMILYTGWWLSRHWRPGWVSLVVLLMAAVLLTPAYPRPGVETMAPALVVAAFQVLTAGWEGAERAIRPLVFMCVAAVVITLLLQLTLFRALKKRRGRRAAAGPAGSSST